VESDDGKHGLLSAPNKALQPTVDPPVSFSIANVPVASTAAEFGRWVSQ
jgi:hypothetical protein